MSGPTRRCRAAAGRRGLCVGLLALALLLAGCGVGTDNGPRALPTSQVPFHLLAPAGSTTSTAPTGVQETVYFLNGNQLVPVARFVPAPPRLRSVLQVLLQGPNSSELGAGLSTDIASQIEVLGDTVSGGIATLDFNQPLAGGTQQVPALGQVVWTATGQPGVHGVRFEIAGTPTAVPTATSAQQPGPVTRADYPSPLP